MIVERIETDDPRWRDLAETHPDATPFHLPAWSTVIADCYRFDAFVLAVLDADREVVAALPTLAVRSPTGRRRWVSLPFSDYCPMLVRAEADTSEVAEALQAHVLGNGVRELEIRADLPAAENVHVEQVGYHHTVPLPADPARLTPNKGHRYSRNRAIRRGVQVTHGVAAQDMATFYRLHTLTRRRHGVPVQPRRFFDLLWDRLLTPGYGFVATATLDDEVMASAIYLNHNGTLVAKYHASDPSQPDTGAGYLIDWETMVYGCNQGYHTLDMGRSDLDADGLRLYKNSWGAVEKPLSYSHLSKQAPRRGRPSVGEFPKHVIRRSPLWVCRALGEVLYRWSA